MSFTKFAGAADTPPSPPFTNAPPGFFAGGPFSIKVVSGANNAVLALCTFVSRVEIIDAAEVAKLPVTLSAGWGPPSIFGVNTDQPTSIGGGVASESPVYALNAVTSSWSAPFYVPAPKWNEVGRPAWQWSGAAPKPPFVPPTPIAFTSTAGIYLALVSSDAAPGTPIVFSVNGS